MSTQLCITRNAKRYCIYKQIEYMLILSQTLDSHHLATIDFHIYLSIKINSVITDHRGGGVG